MSSRFKILLSFAKKSDGSQVYFKYDGRRFKEDKTLKFHVNTTYNVMLQCKPAANITNVTIGSVKVDGSFTKNDTNLSSYQGTWSSGLISKTPAKLRAFLPVTIEFEHGATILTTLQCKVYPVKDKTHVVWGTSLKSIELNCTKLEDQNIFSVDDVTFT